MRKLILCEGKHDSIFFKKLFPKIKIPVSEVRFYDQETRAKLKDLRDAETKELRKFSGDYSPYKILVKSEAGKNKAIDIFSRYLSYCIGKQRKDIEKTILMLDLDNREFKRNRLGEDRLKKNTFEKTLDELDDRIKNSRIGDPVYIEREIIKKTDSIYLIKNNLKNEKNKKQIGNSFYFILFVYSLEGEANIHSSDDVNSIENKISLFVGKTDTQSIFSLLFN